MVREVKALVVQGRRVAGEGGQGKTDGEQWREMERRWGLERRQSFWQVETIDKLISNVGRKFGKTYDNVSNILKINLQNIVARLQPTFEKLLSKIGDTSGKKPKKKREKVSEQLENNVTIVTFQNYFIEPCELCSQVGLSLKCWAVAT